MREALDRIYIQHSKLSQQLSSDRQRMDRMRLGGKALFEAADALVKTGRQEEIMISNFVRMRTVQQWATEPVLVTFQHHFDGESTIDMEAEVHLTEHHMIKLPDTHEYRPGVMMIGQFAESDGKTVMLFAFTNEGDVLNNRGNYVTEEEMTLAEKTLLELGQL